MNSKVISFAIAFISLFIYENAFAQNPHFLPNKPDNTYDAGTTLCSSGTLAGLGNYAGQKVTIQIFVSGTTYTECQNSGGNVAPGQSSSTSYVSDKKEVLVNKQGKADYDMCTNPPNVTTQSAGCPNSKWTGSASGVDFTSGTAYLLVNGQRIDLSY